MFRYFFILISLLIVTTLFAETSGEYGFHMLNMLAKKDFIKNTSIIVITALSKEDIKEHGSLPEGITVYTKPIPFAKIEEQVKLCLEDISDDED